MKTAIESTAFLQNATFILTLIKIARLHIVAIAAMAVFTFGWLFTGDYPWLLTFVCAFDWYIVNLINRIADLPEDRVNAVDGTVFIRQNHLVIAGVSYSLLLVSLFIVHLYLPAITTLRLLGHVLGLCYNWPIIPGKKRLKQLYFWKNTASGIGFLITVFGYPLATVTASRPYRFPVGISWPTIWISAAFFYLFIQSYEILYDLRDIEGDTQAGINTYPVVYGQAKAVFLIDSLIFSAMALLATGYFLAYIPWRIFVMIAAPALQLLIYKPALRKGVARKDCLRATWLGVVLFIIYHLWVLAGLPGSGIST